MKTLDLSDAKNSVIESMGGTASLGRTLGISSQAISQWEIIPLDRVLQIEERSNGKIRCCEMRPDVFPVCPHRIENSVAS